LHFEFHTNCRDRATDGREQNPSGGRLAPEIAGSAACGPSADRQEIEEAEDLCRYGGHDALRSDNVTRLSYFVEEEHKV
jgi:hypothetical protein